VIHIAQQAALSASQRYGDFVGADRAFHRPMYEAGGVPDLWELVGRRSGHVNAPAYRRQDRGDSAQPACAKSACNAKCVGRYRPIGNASIKNPSQTSGWTRRCSLPGPRTQLMFSSEGVVTA
jgi:hypothetical protein